MLRGAAGAITVLMLCVTGCAQDKSEQNPVAPAVAATSATATSSPSALPSSAPVPTSLPPTYLPKLPTEISDDGGSCVDGGRCGYYVAGTSCKGIEWCTKKALVEPGLWSTEGSTDPSGCMWGLSNPPEYGLDDGGYATGYTEVTLKKGAIFDVHECPDGWSWQRR